MRRMFGVLAVLFLTAGPAWARGAPAIVAQSDHPNQNAAFGPITLFSPAEWR
jgi:hypothetical protein